jgi:hypothetical protein
MAAFSPFGFASFVVGRSWGCAPVRSNGMAAVEILCCRQQQLGADCSGSHSTAASLFSQFTKRIAQSTASPIKQACGLVRASGEPRKQFQQWTSSLQATLLNG